MRPIPKRRNGKQKSTDTEHVGSWQTQTYHGDDEASQGRGDVGSDETGKSESYKNAIRGQTELLSLEGKCFYS